MEKPSKKRIALRIILFTLITVLILCIAGRFISIFAVNGLLFWRTTDFYSEPKNSLDAVIVGSSSTYSYWDPTTAWEEYGMAVYPYSTAQQPFSATRFVIEECRRRQPDSLYIINLNLIIAEEITPARIHFLSDVLPPSLNRIRMIKYLCSLEHWDTFDQQFEYYMPVFAMHSRWKKVDYPFGKYNGHGCKGASVDPNFIRGQEDVSQQLVFTDDTGDIPEGVQRELELLTAYLSENNVKAAFYLAPGSLDYDVLISVNSVVDYLRDKGYNVYDGLESFDETGLDPTQDYFDFAHTNANGAHKFTLWLAENLKEDYGFEDKRGNPAYSSWDEAVEKYDAVLIYHQLQ